MSFKDCSVRNTSLKEKQNLLFSYLPLLSDDKSGMMPKRTYLDSNSLFHFQSSIGADITYDYQMCGVGFRCSMAEGEKKSSGS